MNLDLTQLRSDFSHWPSLRHRILGGWSYVLTAAAFIAVVLPILWSGLLSLLVQLGRLLVWISGLLQSAGTTLQQAKPSLDDPALEPLARLVDTPGQASRLAQLIDEPIAGYVINAPVSTSPEPSETHAPAPRPRSRKRSAGAGKRTAAAGFNAGSAGSAG